MTEQLDEFVTSNLEDRKKLKQYTEGYQSYPNDACPYPPGCGEKRTAWWDGYWDARLSRFFEDDDDKETDRKDV